MPIHIALLRAVNVGGRNLVGMSDLRALIESLGFTEVKSLLQSGNLVFRSGRRSVAGLERLLESEIKARFEFPIDCLVRTADQWQAIISANPFRAEAESDPNRLVVMFLKKVPEASDMQALAATVRGPEVVRDDGRHLYMFYPDGIGRSKLTGTLIEQKLRTRGTARNWNTVLKLAALSQAPAL